jgi:Fe-S cluster biogenesis protein NfuA
MPEESLAERVRAILRRIGPALAVDGGGVELDRIDGKTVYVRLTGSCVGCPGADITLRYGIESAITDEVKEITQVVAIEEGAGPAA